MPRLTFALLAAMAALPVLIAVSPASAHPHAIRTSGHVMANGQNHPRFIEGLSCEAYGPPPGQAPVGPAWYGLETAHHGPDAGTPGKGDGCYRLDGTDPAADVTSPVIR